MTTTHFDSCKRRDLLHVQDSEMLRPFLGLGDGGTQEKKSIIFTLTVFIFAIPDSCR
jgi:hypothetical protein